MGAICSRCFGSVNHTTIEKPIPKPTNNPPRRIRYDPPSPVPSSPDSPDVPPQLKAFFAAISLGFQPKERSTTMDEIQKFSPNNGTAMRDAIALGVLKMIALQGAFVEAGLFGHFQFVHVILTDGQDNESKLPT